MASSSAVDDAYTHLQEQILHGGWAPGAKVPTEAALTKSLGVSRTTVREALNRLASTGLIVAPHSGTRLVQDFRDHAGLEVLAALVAGPQGLDLSIVRAVTEMRGAIAPDMARLAALRRTDAQAAGLQETAAALDPAAPVDALLLATLDWWTLLVHASHNLAYRLAYNTLRSTYTQGRAVLREVIADELRAAELYRGIASAVAAHDSTRAHALTVELTSLGGNAIYAVLDAAGGSDVHSHPLP